MTGDDAVRRVGDLVRELFPLGRGTRVELTGRFAMDASLGGGRRLAPMEAGLGLNLWL